MPSVTEPASHEAAAAVAEGAARRFPASQRPAAWLVGGIPVIAALVVGGYRLGGASLWRDEAYTLDAARRSPGQIMNLLLHFDAVHGPYYLGMHLVVTALGSSEAALRLPSLLATSLAAGVTALLGRRLARLSALPAPAATGLLAGLLFAAAPQTTYYAQDARPYGLVALFAAGATYLLVAAIADGRRRYWAGYAAAITLTGMASLFALLILAAHGVTLLVTRSRARPLRWLAAVACSAAAVSPLIVLGYRQDRTLSWLTRPGPGSVISLVADFAGSGPAIPLVIVIAACGVASGLPAARRAGAGMVTVALPWLVLPPFLLLAASVAKPVYVERYVVFCQPALALLLAAGLAWLAGLIAAAPAGRRVPALRWAVPAVIVAVLAAMLAGPQRAARLTSARPDDLREVSLLVAANERPGDAVFYVPSEARVVSMGYPAPFGRLRDIALWASPVASDSLVGFQVPPRVLARRFAGVRRVWVIQWNAPVSTRPVTVDGRAELALLRRAHLIRRWTVQSVLVSLYRS